MSLYAGMWKLAGAFSSLGVWQRRGLALWLTGVMMAKSCQISEVADALLGPWFTSADALTKRLDRFLDNPRISDDLMGKAWIERMLESYPFKHWVILLDETKLADHLSVMFLSLAYAQRALHLLWRCYDPQDYPAEGQVKLICELVERLRALVPVQIVLTMLADRGLGTSPDLIQALLKLPGQLFLLRVQGQTCIRLRNGQVRALNALVKPGEVWYGRGEVFKKAGWIRLWVCIYWKPGEQSPWCLVTNCHWSQVDEYGLRAWHEQSFRDLKSAGLNWQDSAVWEPAHAHRLIFILAVANAWLLSQAILNTPPERISPSRQYPRQSLFRRGLRWLHRTIRLEPDYPFSPDLIFTVPQLLRC